MLCLLVRCLRAGSNHATFGFGLVWKAQDIWLIVVVVVVVGRYVHVQNHALY